MKEACRLSLTSKELYDKRRFAHFQQSFTAPIHEFTEAYGHKLMLSLCLNNCIPKTLLNFRSLKTLDLGVEGFSEPCLHMQNMLNNMNLSILEHLKLNGLGSIPDLLNAIALKSLELKLSRNWGTYDNEAPVKMRFKCGSKFLKVVKLESDNHKLKTHANRRLADVTRPGQAVYLNETLKTGHITVPATDLSLFLDALTVPDALLVFKMDLIYISGTVEENHEFLNRITRTYPKSVVSAQGAEHNIRLKFENTFDLPTETTRPTLCTKENPGLHDCTETHERPRPSNAPRLHDPVLRAGVRREKSVWRILKGERVSGKREGYGILIEGDVDIRNGLEILSRPERMYEGQWENDKQNGYGVWRAPGYFPESDRVCDPIEPPGMDYEGQWQNGEWHGYGTLTNRVHETENSGDCFVIEEKYVGQFKHGLTHGYGRKTWASKAGEEEKNHYVGQWNCGKRDGRGEFTWRNGAKYIGQFKNNRFHGQGTVRTGHSAPAGDRVVYCGQFVNGKRHGNGTPGDEHGYSLYHGQFENDIANQNNTGAGSIVLFKDLPVWKTITEFLKMLQSFRWIYFWIRNLFFCWCWVIDIQIFFCSKNHKIFCPPH